MNMKTPNRKAVGLLAMMEALIPGSVTELFRTRPRHNTPIGISQEFQAAAEAKRERKAQRNRELKIRSGLR